MKLWDWKRKKTFKDKLLLFTTTFKYALEEAFKKQCRLEVSKL